MFAIPTLKELVERARQSFRSNLPGSDAYIWPNNINPTAKVLAGFVHEVFGFADYIFRQRFALTADGENLDLHGEELGLARRPTAPATGKVRLSTTGDYFVATGASFRRLDGFEYVATADASRTGAGALDVIVIALADGQAGNAIAGTSLEIMSGVTGDALAAVGDAGIYGGVEIEDDESFRARILFRKRYPPHGGSAADYVQWATSIAGVTRVFIERLWSGSGTVRVFPLMDDLYPADGIAGSADIARVAEYIDMVRPSGAVVSVVAPTRKTINVTITDLTPDTAATREAVLAELRAMFRRLSRVAGIDTRHGGMPFLAVDESFSRSWIWQAIANATGEERHVLTSPAADTPLNPGELAVLGTVTFA